MKRKTTTIIEEFDEKGNLKYKSTETTEEEDEGYIYPQSPTYINPLWSTTPMCGTGSFPT